MSQKEAIKLFEDRELSITQAMADYKRLGYSDSYNINKN